MRGSVACNQLMVYDVMVKISALHYSVDLRIQTGSLQITEPVPLKYGKKSPQNNRGYTDISVSYTHLTLPTILRV